MAFSYKFAVVRGVQAQREYFIAMIPLGLLSKLFQNEDEYILPEYRAQRGINEARIPEIRDYILNNKNTYVFSALSASIDGTFEFHPSEIDDNVGILEVDMGAVLLINDGQHRKAAIEAALIEAPELAKETISIVLFKDEGLKRSQQMFADLNKHAVKSTMSLSTLYDYRDDLANAVKEVVFQIPFLNKYIDKEKDNLGKNSSKLFTLANFLRANRRIIRKNAENHSIPLTAPGKARMIVTIARVESEMVRKRNRFLVVLLSFSFPFPACEHGAVPFLKGGPYERINF